jgi:hypothetical protein
VTDRIPLDHLTSDQYDQLCDELDRARAELQRHAEHESADAAAGSYAGRAEAAEAATNRIRALADRWAKAGPPPLGTPIARWWDKRLVELNTALAEPAPATRLRASTPAPLTPAEETRLALDGIDTPDCDCGHDGMGVSWHSDDCPWRRGIVDRPGRPAPG